MPGPSFAFLALQEHPFAREMLRQLLGAGHVPALIVEEASGLAARERDKFLERIAGHPLAPSIAQLASTHAIELRSVPRHSSESLLAEFARPQPLELDLVVLGGTRILRGALLDYPRDGVVNSHPGLLPDCRGSASPAWSVYHDIPVGASTHLCDKQIDTGDLLLRRELPVSRGMTYADLVHGTLVLAGVLMREALDAHARGEWSRLRRAQGESPWPTFKNAPEEVLEVVERKLAEQTYAHYVD